MRIQGSLPKEWLKEGKEGDVQVYFDSNQEFFQSLNSTPEDFSNVIPNRDKFR